MIINTRFLRRFFVPIAMTLAITAFVGLILYFEAPASIYDELSVTITPKNNQAFAAESEVFYSIGASSTSGDIGGVKFEIFAVKNGVSQWILVHEKDLTTGYKQYLFTGSLGELANGSYSIKGTAWLSGRESETLETTATIYVGVPAFGVDLRKYASLELLFPLLSIPILIKWRKHND